MVPAPAYVGAQSIRPALSQHSGADRAVTAIEGRAWAAHTAERAGTLKPHRADDATGWLRPTALGPVSPHAESVTPASIAVSPSGAAGPDQATRWARRGWESLDASRITVPDAETRYCVEHLAIQPAWQQVWITPFRNGHRQAVGTTMPEVGDTCTTRTWRTSSSELDLPSDGEAIPVDELSTLGARLAVDRAVLRSLAD